MSISPVLAAHRGDLALIDIRTGRATKLTTTNPIVTRIDASPSHKLASALIARDADTPTLSPHFDVLIVPLGTGAPRTVALDAQPSTALSWSRRDDALAYGAGNRVVLVDVSGGASHREFSVAGAAQRPAWDPDGNAVYAVIGANTIVRISGEQGAQPKPIAQLTGHVPRALLTQEDGNTAWLAGGHSVVVIAQNESTLEMGFHRIDVRTGVVTGHLVAQQRLGPHAGSIYLVSNGSWRGRTGRSVGSIFVTRSTDGGKTFTSPVHIVPSNLNFNVLTPGVLSDGTLVVPYTDFQSNISDFRSRAGELERKRAWVITSTDGGQTFSHPLFVSEACGLGFGSLAVNVSARPTRDRLYFICNNRELDGILVHNSENGGDTWSQPVRADATTGEVVFRRPPAIAVNRDGVVGVTWYERRTEEGQQCQHLSFTASLDGGKTFLTEVRVSSAPSCPDTARNGRVATRWPEGGDYSGLAAAADGTFHVLWADSRDGIYRLWTAPVTVKVTAAGKM